MQLPGDKSISHRALMLAALAGGSSRLANLSAGTDVLATRNCLEQCGIPMAAESGAIVVHGRGGAFTTPEADLDCGNSGTTARLLAGLLAGRGIQARLTGDASLSLRPMERVAAPLRQLGATLTLSPDGTLPLDIQPARLNTLDYQLPVASAQVKSALLLAGLASDGAVTVRESVPTRNHTEIMLQFLGADITVSGTQVILGVGRQPLAPFSVAIPGDPSSAAFLAALAVLLPGTEIRFENLLLNPTRLAFFQALQRMGGKVAWAARGTSLGEIVGDLTVRSSTLMGITLEGEAIPPLIDELPILAVLASQAEGVTNVRDAGELRVKESDRLGAICENLTRMGGQVDERADGFRIVGPTRLRGAPITTHGDHRIAMAFTVAGQVATGPVSLDDPGCIDISFPGFHELLTQGAPEPKVLAS